MNMVTNSAYIISTHYDWGRGGGNHILLVLIVVSSLQQSGTGRRAGGWYNQQTKVCTRVVSYKAYLLRYHLASAKTQ